MRHWICAVATGLAFAVLTSCGGGSGDDSGARVTVEPLSSRADLVSGGSTLLRLRLPSGAAIPSPKVTVGGQDVSSAFKQEPGSQALLGVIGGLANGTNTVVVSSGTEASIRGQLALVNHPVSGPLISSPQQTPYVCELESFGMAPALDANCSAATRVDYFYRSSTTSAYKPLDTAAALPADVANTTTSEGTVVPYIVRREMGTVNRAVYVIAFLHEPGKPLPDPWTRTPGWNGRLVYSYGGGVRAGYHQGRSVGGLGANTNHLESASVSRAARCSSTPSPTTTPVRWTASSPGAATRTS
jgi:hypothetical protein